MAVDVAFIIEMTVVPLLLLVLSVYFYAQFHHTNEQYFGKHILNRLVAVLGFAMAMG